MKRQSLSFPLPGWLRQTAGISWRWVKWLGAFAAIGFVGFKFSQAPEGFFYRWEIAAAWPWLLGAWGLSIVNWGIEIWKWRLLMRRLVPGYDGLQAARAVLIGITAGLITPNRIGEYAGRASEAPHEKRAAACGLLFADRLAQLSATLGGGWFAIWALSAGNRLPLEAFGAWRPWVVPGAGGLFFAFTLGFLLLRPGLVGRLLPIQAWQKAWGAWTLLTMRLRALIVAASWARFAVFCLQFGLLLQGFGVGAAFTEGIAASALVFWLKSLAPSLALGEIGVREAVAIAVGSWLGWDALGCAFAAFVLFAINLLLPALLGLGPWMAKRSTTQA